MRTFLTALTFVAMSLRADASQIAIGIDWRKNIFIQEIWKDGVPYYQIANLNKDAATITVTDRKEANLLAGPWVVRAQDTLTMDVRNLIDKGLMSFKLSDGSSLGLMPSPTKEAAVKGTIVSYDGLNGSGGRQTTLWIEQATETFPAGADFTVTLKIPANSGVVKWSQKAETNGTMSQLPLLEAKSETLPISNKGALIEIDTGKPTKQEAIHSVTLRFRTPATPTMVMISGFRFNANGGGHGITRGIVVTPAK